MLLNKFDNKKKTAAALDLLHQILEHEKEKDKEHQINSLKKAKGSQAIGESFTIHYLKNLRELLLLIQKDL